MLKRKGQRSHVVLVVGDSSGIGRACCEEFVDRGRIVYGASRTKLNDTTWQHLYMDVRDESSVADAIGHIVEREGVIDAVVHASGVSLVGPLEETSIDEAQRHFDTNYFGVVRVLRAVLPTMRVQGHGKLVLIGSIGGLIGLPYACHYSASKSALDRLVEALRPEIQPFGIEVAAVHPGDFRTAITNNRQACAAAQSGSPYYDKFSQTAGFYGMSEEGARSPNVLAKGLDALLDWSNLPVRIVFGTQFERLGVFGKTWLPSRLFEQLVGKVYRP